MAAGGSVTTAYTCQVVDEVKLTTKHTPNDHPVACATPVLSTSNGATPNSARSKSGTPMATPIHDPTRRR